MRIRIYNVIDKYVVIPLELLDLEASEKSGASFCANYC